MTVYFKICEKACSHQPITKNKRWTGKDREKIKSELLEKGNDFLRSENIVFNNC